MSRPLLSDLYEDVLTLIALFLIKDKDNFLFQKEIDFYSFLNTNKKLKTLFYENSHLWSIVHINVKSFVNSFSLQKYNSLLEQNVPKVISNFNRYDFYYSHEYNILQHFVKLSTIFCNPKLIKKLTIYPFNKKEYYLKNETMKNCNEFIFKTFPNIEFLIIDKPIDSKCCQFQWNSIILPNLRNVICDMCCIEYDIFINFINLHLSTLKSVDCINLDVNLSVDLINTFPNIINLENIYVPSDMFKKLTVDNKIEAIMCEIDKNGFTISILNSFNNLKHLFLSFDIYKIKSIQLLDFTLQNLNTLIMERKNDYYSPIYFTCQKINLPNLNKLVLKAVKLGIDNLQNLNINKLTDLTLDSINLDDNLFNYILSKVQCLKIEGNKYLENFNITLQNLNYLKTLYLSFLQKLTVNNCPNVKQITLLNVMFADINCDKITNLKINNPNSDERRKILITANYCDNLITDGFGLSLNINYIRYLELLNTNIISEFKIKEIDELVLNNYNYSSFKDLFFKKLTFKSLLTGTIQLNNEEFKKLKSLNIVGELKVFQFLCENGVGELTEYYGDFISEWMAEDSSYFSKITKLTLASYEKHYDEIYLDYFINLKEVTIMYGYLKLLKLENKLEHLQLVVIRRVEEIKLDLQLNCPSLKTFIFIKNKKVDNTSICNFIYAPHLTNYLCYPAIDNGKKCLKKKRKIE
ncbi:hypothetical protein ABK040_006066 [Willaertia magna]